MCREGFSRGSVAVRPPIAAQETLNAITYVYVKAYEYAPRQPSCRANISGRAKQDGRIGESAWGGGRDQGHGGALQGAAHLEGLRGPKTE